MLIKSARHALLAASAVGVLAIASSPRPRTPAGVGRRPPAAEPADTVDQLLVTSLSTTRSAVQLSGSEMQKILPGLSPLKAIQTLPGVLYVTADPWGNNEQNTSLFIHGFNGQQLGYTLDGVPLGDQSYGNYNGLSPQRAVISEVVGKVILSSGAGSLGTASTSNLGGAVETFTNDPRAQFGGQFNQTLGSYDTSRTFVRLDTGDLRREQRPLPRLRPPRRPGLGLQRRPGRRPGQPEIRPRRRGRQADLLPVVFRQDRAERGRHHPLLPEPRRQADRRLSALHPPVPLSGLPAALNYLDAAGNYPASEGENYRNYYSAAQRTDYLSYVKYDAKLSENVTWSNQVYYHDDHGRGIVAGPIRVAGLPALFNFYFPNQNLKQVFGNSGYATRTTEYQIDRLGGISTLKATLGDHQIEAGFWYEHNKSSAYRRWYPFDVNHPTTPYDVPTGWLITQYGSEIDNKVYQFYVQDQWRIREDLVLQGGFKSSLQTPRARCRCSRSSARWSTRPACRSAISRPRSGSCRSWARSGLWTAAPKPSSTSRRTCATSRPMAAAACRRSAWAARRRSTSSRRPPSPKPPGPTRRVCAASATSSWARSPVSTAS
jgi:iron complex outermembrane receptor protein